MNYVVVLTFIVATLLSISGYSDTSPWWTHFTYVFPHSGFFHLFINSIAYFSLFNLLKQRYSKWLLLSVPYIIAVVMSLFSSYPIPTVGASGMIYSMIGFFIGLVIIKRIRFKHRWYLGVFIFGMSLGFIISFFKESSNTLLHGLCLVAGAIIILLYENNQNRRVKQDNC